MSVACDLHRNSVMGAGIIVGIAFFSLAGYIARLAVRGLARNGNHAERQRPLRHQPPPAKLPKTS
jgi:F0F1-type ATP synthase membrane subunit c/vacuolar-type H+-ATPase subunit K